MPACQRGPRSPSASPTCSFRRAQCGGGAWRGPLWLQAVLAGPELPRGVCVGLCLRSSLLVAGPACEHRSAPPPLQASVPKLPRFSFCPQHLRGAEDCPLAQEDDRDRQAQRVRLRGLPHQAGREGETSPTRRPFLSEPFVGAAAKLCGVSLFCPPNPANLHDTLGRKGLGFVFGGRGRSVSPSLPAM